MEIHKTYTFRKWDHERKDYREVFEFFYRDSGTIKPDEAVDQEGLLLYQLFQPIDPQKPYAEEYYTRTILHKYFKEVLSLGNSYNGQITRLLYNKIILEKQIFSEINELIEQYNFQAHRDLFFYLIAQIQEYYTDTVIRQESPAKQEQIKNIDSQALVLEQILDWHTDKSWQKDIGKPNPIPNAITFFYKRKEFKIMDSFLIHDILEGAKNQLEHSPYFDWRIGLRRTVSIMKGDTPKKAKFFDLISVALNRFLTQEKFFRLEEGKETNNQATYFLGEILKYCLFLDLTDEQLKTEKLKEDKISFFKTRLGRSIKKVGNHPIEAVDYLEVVPKDFETLSKYFPPQFLNLCPPEKRIGTLSNATILIERFRLEKYGLEVIHILACFQSMIEGLESDFRLYSQGIIEQPKIQAFFEFLNGGSETLTFGKIKSISFRKEGIDSEFIISEQEPLELIQKALNEYVRNHPEDISNDLILVDHTVDPTDGLPMIGLMDSYRPTNQRFYPWFSKQFYLYLTAQFPKDGYYPKVAAERKLIIAVTILLFQNHLFLEKEKEEDMYFKVEEWLEISGLEIPKYGVRG